MARQPALTADAAWAELLAALGDAGDAVAALDGTVPDIDVVEGYRFVLQVLGDQLDRAAARGSSRPLFLPAITPVRKLFFDNPDTTYDTAFVDPRRTYRIRGNRGRASYLSFCVYAGDFSTGATRVQNLDDTHMTFAADGSFECTLSATPAESNWLRLEPDAHTVIARQYFLDRQHETPASYDIDIVADGPGASAGRATPDAPAAPDAPLDAATFARVARRTAAFVRGATRLARDRADAARATPNRFHVHEGHGAFGTPDAGYVACWYDLADDEVLVIDVVPPACRYWGVHLANRWGQSLDHRTRRTALNARTATVGDGGSVRVVVGARAPGEANWLDTAGHPQGWVLFRWLQAAETVVPVARIERSNATPG